MIFNTNDKRRLPPWPLCWDTKAWSSYAIRQQFTAYQVNVINLPFFLFKKHNWVTAWTMSAATVVLLHSVIWIEAAALMLLWWCNNMHWLMMHYVCNMQYSVHTLWMVYLVLCSLQFYSTDCVSSDNISFDVINM